MILAILQARVSSTRLPGKVLKPIVGKPMLQHQIERLRRVRLVDKLIVATSHHESDNALAKLCQVLAVSCFRGELDDVLDRFYQAARPFEPDQVVRLTGDCPLADPDLIDRIVQYHLDNDLDYTSNTIHPSYPDGLDAEVLRFEVLKTAWEEARRKSQREHVTPFVWQQPKRFKLANYANQNNLAKLRWTVDEPEDFELVRTIYEELYPQDPCFGTQDILDLITRRPELQKMNSHFSRNEGILKSLAEDFVGGNTNG